MSLQSLLLLLLLLLLLPAPPCAKAWSTTTSGSPRAMRAWSSASGARRSAQTKALRRCVSLWECRARASARAAGTMSTPTEKKERKKRNERFSPVPHPTSRQRANG